MCGIFGVYDWSGETIFDLRTMAGSIAHRGPDAEGIFSEAGIAFGNRRLSVIDMSEASNQPLYSSDEDIVVVQNGAIYNYIELRQELTGLGHVFRTKGDTEVVLNAFIQWGPGFVQRLNGMFAIAIYQKSKRKLWLFRDRLGVKPLYISGSPLEGKLWFASEIKAILTNGVKYNVNLDALSQFMALNYVPPPQTMFERIVHLPAGHWVVLCPQEGVRVQKYWSLDEIEPDEAIDFATAQASFMALLDDATRIRLRADAPFGAFLSGGLDSASVVAMMSLHQRNAIRTYAVGFDSELYDETKWARLAARRFGTLHHTMTMEPNIESDWERFIWHCDQPHGDVSFIPSDHISAIAAQDVKMVLTGDGGDELWGGYSKYLDVFTDASGVNIRDDWKNSFLQGSWLLDKELAASLLTGEFHSLFLESSPDRALANAIEETNNQDPINSVLAAETKILLPGNNLVKPDRMAMANGLEVRSPYLDYRMVELAFKVPGKHKLKGGIGKAIPKAVLLPILGDDLTFRKKQMFTMPVGDWFKNDLEVFARNILLDGRLGERNLFSPHAIEDLIKTHTDGQQNHTRLLRSLISVEIWHRQFIDGDKI